MQAIVFPGVNTKFPDSTWMKSFPSVEVMTQVYASHYNINIQLYYHFSNMLYSANVDAVVKFNCKSTVSLNLYNA